MKHTRGRSPYSGLSGLRQKARHKKNEERAAAYDACPVRGKTKEVLPVTEDAPLRVALGDFVKNKQPC